MARHIICLWPGLPRLWIRGDWTALAIAIAFGLVLNLVLVSSFVWSELLPASLVTGGWILVGLVWIGSMFHGIQSLPNLREPPGVNDQGLFIQAQAEYLKGHWFEAETLLRQLLRECCRDVDALLMLATLYRHTRRHEEATKQLDQLERLDEAVKWRWEIERERELLKRNSVSAPDDEAEGTETGTDATKEEVA